jgi:hypothetical protein
MQVVSGLAAEKEYLAMPQLSQYKRNVFSMHTKFYFAAGDVFDYVE